MRPESSFFIIICISPWAYLVAGVLESLSAMAHAHLEIGVASPFLVRFPLYKKIGHVDCVAALIVYPTPTYHAIAKPTSDCVTRNWCQDRSRWDPQAPGAVRYRYDRVSLMPRLN